MEVTSAAGTAPAPVAGNIVSAGLPESMDRNVILSVGEENQGNENQNTGDEGAGGTNNVLPELTEDQLKAILDSKGIKFEGTIEEWKNKLNTTPSPPDVKPELTPEQKLLQEQIFEKRMLDLHMANGGTAEQFVALKNILASDLRALSIGDIQREMKEGGFSDEEVTSVINERYYQLNPEEAERLVDESDEDFDARKAALKKKVDYGSKKLEERGLNIKKTAESLFNNLREGVTSQDLEVAQEKEIVAQVAAISKALPRKLTLDLGMVENQPISPVEYQVKEEDISEALSLLSDSGKRNKFLYTEDGGLNLTNLAGVLVENRNLKAALRAVYDESSSRQVSELRKVFPMTNAHDLGVGGVKGGINGRKGVIVSAGAPEPMPIKRAN